MAYTSKDFHEDLAIFSAGALLGPTRTRQMLAFAARKGISLVGLGARTAAAPAARAITNPYVAGAALGGAALQTEPGQELLARAAESGRQTRRDLDMVSAGMKAVKKSKFNGKPGVLTNAKRTFTQVTKTASKIRKGKKVSAKGVIGTIARAVRPKLKKRKAGKTKMAIRVKGRDY
jgi:hypothetical protein